MSVDLEVLSSLALAAPPAVFCSWCAFKFFELLVERKVIPPPPRKDAVKVILSLAFMAWTIALAGIASYTYTYASSSERSVATTTASAVPPAAAAAAPLSKLESGGWVFGGYFTKAGVASEDVMVSARGLSEIQKGRSVVLTADRDVRILDYKTDPHGWKKRPSSRIQGIGSQDHTDVVLKKGQRVMVRQVDRFEDGDRFGVWLRVVPLLA